MNTKSELTKNILTHISNLAELRKGEWHNGEKDILENFTISADYGFCEVSFNVKYKNNYKRVPNNN